MTPLAHTRYEYLDTAHFPQVGMLVNGSRFNKWDEFVEDHDLKIASQRTHSLAIGLFIDFIAARAEEFKGNSKLFRKLHRSFSESLLMGTVDGGACQYQLWWTGRTVSGVNKILRALNAFLVWIAEDMGTQSVLPSRNATTSEQIKFWARWRFRKQNSLMGHLKKKARDIDLSRIYQATSPGRSFFATSHAPKRFPDHEFPALLNSGFKRRTSLRWSSLRDRMIVLLLHGGGLRLSEALAMWINDLYPDPDDSEAVILRLYEPHEGIVKYKDPATGKYIRITRSQYLQQRHGKLPLSMQPGNRNIGSKANLYDDARDKYSLVYWRDPSYGRAFKRLYAEYVLIRPIPNNHPYLFITPDGESMTIKGFEKVHAAAVRRIGGIASASLGTTPHGHRHDYAHFLRAGGLPEKVIQVAMHHRSVVSQQVYGNLTGAEALRSIRTLIQQSPIQLT